jgi:hypothetical protein
MRREIRRQFLVALGLCAQQMLPQGALAGSNDVLIAKHAAAYGVPEQLVRRVIRIESGGNPRIISAGNYGLMQIRLGTARSVGYHGDAEGLLDADTNLTYAVKYLAGAYRAAGCDENRAVSYYQRGYYGASRGECPGPSSIEDSQAEFKLAEKVKRESAAAKSANAAAEPSDVIRPRVVRTETIGKLKPIPVRPVGAFEPKRAAPPPMPASPPLPPRRPIEEAKAIPASSPPAASAVAVAPAVAVASGKSNTRPSGNKADTRKPVAPQVELASVPMPPERAEPQPSRHEAQTSRHEAQTSRHEDVEREPRRVHHSSRRAAAAADNTPAVVTFLRKLVTPEKEQKQRRRRAVRSDTSGVSRVPPPL